MDSVETQLISLFKEWFNFTPSTDEVFQNNPACRVRIPKRYIPFELNNINCFKLSNIVKYFDRGFACYWYEPKFTNQTLSLTEYTMAPGSTGIIYDIYFKMKSFLDQKYNLTPLHIIATFLFPKYRSASTTDEVLEKKTHEKLCALID